MATRPGSRSFRRNVVQAFAAAAACFVVLLGSIQVAGAWDRDAYSLYVDINPSLRFSVNGINQVVGVAPLNEEGIALIEEADLSGDVQTVATSIIETAEAQGYDLDDSITFTVVTEDPDTLAYIQEVAGSKLLGDKGVEVQVLICTPEEETEALLLGITPRKYKLAQRVARETSGLTFEEALKLNTGHLSALDQGEVSMEDPVIIV
ncbi:MAG: hypothetical protein LBR14_02320 [Clostridiales Family XIII bacterium]|nr:hypothetical protein [Clostridiales Family XIII bacterium]